MRLLPLLLVIWFINGAIAAYQRSYFTSVPSNCAKAGTVAVTVLAGPLNYAGVNPKVHSCHLHLPKPSK